MSLRARELLIPWHRIGGSFAQSTQVHIAKHGLLQETSCGLSSSELNARMLHVNDDKPSSPADPLDSARTIFRFKRKRRASTKQLLLRKPPSRRCAMQSPPSGNSPLARFGVSSL